MEVNRDAKRWNSRRQKNGQEFVAKITIMEIKMMMWHLLRWIGCMSKEIGSGMIYLVI